MSEPEIDEALNTTGMFCAVLNSLAKFDELEVRGVASAIVSPTLPEECVLSIYYRASANVQSMLQLKSPLHVQAAAMLARSIFELTVDIGIFNIVQGAPIKMRVYLDVEKLRAAKSAVEFAKSNPLTLQPSVEAHQEYIDKNEARIKALIATTWPEARDQRGITHWSGKKLAERVRLLSVDMSELYAVFYRQLSWLVHPGLAGSYGVKPETFAQMHGLACHLASRNYEQILTHIIRMVKLEKADPDIEKKMAFAKYVPLTDSAEREVELRRELGLPDLPVLYVSR